MESSHRFAGSSAYFAAESCDGAELVHPLDRSASRWNAKQVRGPALAGILARAAERAFSARPDLWPARSTFEFFTPVAMAPCESTASYVRENRRLAMVESLLFQQGEPVARAQILLLAPSRNPAGVLWDSSAQLPPPRRDVPADVEDRLYRVGDDEWCADAGVLRGLGRRQVWQRPAPIVHGEAPSDFQLVASASDLTNMVAHVSDVGIQYINAEVSVVATRPSQGDGVGVAGMLQIAEAGISVGTGVLFDSAGAFATTSVTSLANDDRTVRIG